MISKAKAARIGEGGDRFVWDTKLTGFGYRVRNSHKTYVVQYRVKDTHLQRRLKIGDASTTSNCILTIYSSGSPCCMMNSLVLSTLDFIFPLVLLCKCSSKSKEIRRSPGEVTRLGEQAYASRRIKSTSSSVWGAVISGSLKVWTIARAPDRLIC